MGEGGCGDAVRRIEVLHGVAETVMEGGNQGDGSVEPGSVGDVVGGSGMKAMAEELAESFAGLEGDGAIWDGGEIVG